jgi:hypothetical protein
MSSEEKPEKPHVSYNWNVVALDLRIQQPTTSKTKAQKKKEKGKKQTESAAAKDLLEALEEQRIVDEIEIKQEIVLDPNE